MHVNTLITSYLTADAPANPLIRVHLITTDSNIARNNYEAMVAREMRHPEWVGDRCDSTQTTLVKERPGKPTEYLTIKLHFATEPAHISLGRGGW